MAATKPTKGSATAAAAAAKPKRSQASRKGKAAWRKNIDTTEIDEHLESQRAAERLGASRADPATAKDAELFQVDVEGDQDLAKQLLAQRRNKAKKPMRSLQVLENTSAVPGLARKGSQAASTSSSSSSSSRKGAGKMSKAEQDRLRRIAQRAVKGPFGAIVDETERAGLQALDSVKGAVMKMPDRDAWEQDQADAAAAAAAAAAAEQEEEARIQAGPSSSTSKSLPRLPVVPQTGQSYNPSLASHNALLQQAYEVEKHRAAIDQQEREFKLKWVEAGKHARETEGRDGDDGDAAEDGSTSNGKRKKRFFAGMLIGSGDEAATDDEEDEKGSESSPVVGQEEADESTARKALAPGQRKTRQQRQKEARQLAVQRLALQKRLLKEEASLMARLPSLSKAMQRRARQRAAELAERRSKEAEKMAREGLAGKRFGKHRVPEDIASRSGLEVQLGEDLSESLRGVKRHEGLNLFREQWDSLTARGLAEPTKPVEKKGRDGRRKFKEYETHAYKRFV